MTKLKDQIIRLIGMHEAIFFHLFNRRGYIALGQFPLATKTEEDKAAGSGLVFRGN